MINDGRINNWIISIGSDISNGHSNLSAAKNDAIDIINMFSLNWMCPKENRILLTGDKATTANIKTTINEILLRRVAPNDSILIFLSGHIEPNIKNITGSFVSFDFLDKPNNLGLNLRSLRNCVEDSIAKYIVVIIDGCYSGIITQAEKRQTSHWIYFNKGEMDSFISSKLFITAVTSGETTFERSGNRNSVFTEQLISVVNEAFENNEELSTCLFYDKLSKKISKHNMAPPTLSGVEVGYSRLIYDSSNNLSKDSCLIEMPLEDNNSIPSWLQMILVSNKINSNLSDGCVFICDNNYPDGSILKTGEKIIKSWRIKNSGVIKWENRFYKFVGSSRGTGLIHGKELTPIPDVNPGDEVDIKIELQMPPYAGSVYAEFKMVSPNGDFINPESKGLYVHLHVLDKK